MAAEEALVFSEVAREYVSFLASFAAIGAMGFRWFPMRGLVGGAAGDLHGARGRMALRAGRTAAAIGLLGTLVMNASERAAEKGTSVQQVLMDRGAMGAIGLGLVSLAAVGYLLAIGRLTIGWVLATIGLLGNSLKNGVSGDVLRLVNPVHVMMASLWIGTLAVMVIAGIGAALRSDAPRDERGPAVAAMVNAFSPLALFSAAFLAFTGVVTAWRHLKVLENLWTTPYGWALLVKLALVLGVVTLGAWNWRRVRPTLGGTDAAHRIRRSSMAELGVAALVLAATAVLVSLPAPRAPGGGGPGGPGGPPPQAGAPAASAPAPAAPKQSG
jgi:copper transport protein